ncbi:chalcone isomerase family protein [Undibacterium sp. SXout7W]|uniref:chalcone isomerase family protein n=1 Tax=Undibacterium sp. SXout7W TaxID=3413049 RepID=UPI003BF1D0CD
MNFATRFTKSIFFSLLSALLIATHSNAAEIGGVKIDDTAQVANQTLKLNGAGIRYKVFFKVYVAALYLAEQKNSAPEILALPGAKRVSLVILRDLRSEELGQRFMDGIKKNADLNERTKLVDSMLAFGQNFALLPDMKKGDIINMDWIPGSGATAFYNGKKFGSPIQDPLFYSALLKIWIGHSPVDDKLKQAWLSGKIDEGTH